MVSPFSNWERRITTALLLWCALGLVTARAQSDGKPTGGGALSGTNYFAPGGGSDKPLPGQGRMDRIEQDLFGTQKPLSLDQPIESLVPPEQPKTTRLTPALEERMKEKMDENKNWAFSAMNELTSPPTPEEMLGLPELGPDGRPKPKLSAMEKYYQNLDKRQQVESNAVTDVMTVMWNLQQLSGTNGMNAMIFAFPGGEQMMMKNLLMPPDPAHGGWDRSAAGESAPASGGAAAAATAAADQQEQNRRLDSFKRILGGGSAAPGGLPDSSGGINNLLNPQPSATPAFNPGYTPAPAVSAPFNQSALSPVMGGFTPSASGYQPPASGFNPPMMGPGGLNNTTGNTWTQAPKTTLPPTVDPFTQNFPKRQF